MHCYIVHMPLQGVQLSGYDTIKSAYANTGIITLNYIYIDMILRYLLSIHVQVVLGPFFLAVNFCGSSYIHPYYNNYHIAPNFRDA